MKSGIFAGMQAAAIRTPWKTEFPKIAGKKRKNLKKRKIAFKAFSARFGAFLLLTRSGPLVYAFPPVQACGMPPQKRVFNDPQMQTKSFVSVWK